MTETSPRRKLLSIWEILGIALLCQIACILPVVALRELAGLQIPIYGAFAGGALVTLFAIQGYARRKNR